MENVVNTLLYCYPSFQSVLNGMEKLAYYKAMVSFANSNKTVEQVEKILQINDQKKRLLKLKRIIEEIISEFSDEERILIKQKFFKRTTSDKYDSYDRTYYRRQKVLFQKLIVKFTKRKYDVNWFLKNYGDIYFLKAKYLTIKKLAHSDCGQSSKKITAI